MLDEVSLLHLHFYHSDINEWFLPQFLLSGWLMVVAERARGCHWPPLDGSLFIGRCAGAGAVLCWLHMKAKHDKKLPGHSGQQQQPGQVAPPRCSTFLALGREGLTFTNNIPMFNLIRYNAFHKDIKIITIFR